MWEPACSYEAEAHFDVGASLLAMGLTVVSLTDRTA
jgi:hypothetical protein